MDTITLLQIYVCLKSYAKYQRNEYILCTAYTIRKHAFDMKSARLGMKVHIAK